MKLVIKSGRRWYRKPRAPTSRIRGSVVLLGDDGDVHLLLFLYLPSQQLSVSPDEDDDAAGLLVGEDHGVRLAVGGVVVGTGNVGDGDQVPLQVHFKRA